MNEEKMYFEFPVKLYKAGRVLEIRDLKNRTVLLPQFTRGDNLYFDGIEAILTLITATINENENYLKDLYKTIRDKRQPSNIHKINNSDLSQRINSLHRENVMRSIAESTINTEVKSVEVKKRGRPRKYA